MAVNSAQCRHDTLTLHCVAITCQRNRCRKNRNLEGDFSFIFYNTFCSRERRKPRLQNNPNPEFDHEPDTEGREKEALFMPSIREKPCKNSSFLDKEGPGNIAKVDRISSYLPQEHWYCKLQLPNFKLFFNLAAYKKYSYASECILIKKKRTDIQK